MTGATRCGPTNRSRCGNPPATLGASVDSTTGPWRPGGGSLRKPSGIWATDKCFRTLYPIGADGGPDTSQPGVVAPLGIALYVAGADVAVGPGRIADASLQRPGRRCGSNRWGRIGGSANEKVPRLRGDHPRRRQGVQALWVPLCPPRRSSRQPRNPSVVQHEAKALRGTVRRVAISFDVGEHGARPDDSRGRSWTVWRFGVQGADTWREVSRDQDMRSGGYVCWAACSIVLLISAAVLVAVFIGLLTT
jgi:hypothetical protein